MTLSDVTSIPKMATCSFREWHPSMGVRVGTTVGRNKRHPGIDELEAFKPRILFKAPYRTAPPDQMRIAYRAALNSTRDVIDASLRGLAEAHPGETLVFLCYEVLSQAGAYCHRTWLAEWLAETYQVEVPELGKTRAPDTATVEEPPTLV